MLSLPQPSNEEGTTLELSTSGDHNLTPPNKPRSFGVKKEEEVHTGEASITEAGSSPLHRS